MHLPTATWGDAPWLTPAPLSASEPPEQRSTIIVGAGLTGLSAAYHLARRGIDVAVLDAETIGSGASGRTGGLALEDTAAGIRTGVGDCLPFLARLVSDAGIACDLRLQGCRELAHATTPPHDTWAWRDDDSYLVRHGMVPGGTVDPVALLQGLARAAVAAGATIHEHHAVTAIAPGRPSTLGVSGRTLTAEHVVLALNAYTPTLYESPKAIRAALTFALGTAPLPDAVIADLGLADGRPFYTADTPYLWGRTLSDGRLVLGAGLTFDPDNTLRRIAIDKGDAAQALARLETRVRRFHPRLARVEITHRWGGPVAFRTDAEPIVGHHPDTDRMIVTGAYAGHGVALSVRVGALVAAAIADGQALPPWGAVAPRPTTT